MAADQDMLHDVQPMVLDSRPLASQLTEKLRELIQEGALESGTRLPTEAELADRFRVGRTTVREALKQLESEGTVLVRRGRGRYVSGVPALRRPITRLESVTAMLASHGYRVENRILSADMHSPGPEEAVQLRLGAGERVFRLIRLRLHGDEPLIYSVDVFPVGKVGPADGIDWRGSLFEILAERGIRPVTSVATISAAQLPDEAAAACGTEPDLPWLLMVQLNLLEDGTPVIYSHDYHRGDRFSFDLLRRTDPGAGQQ